MKISKLLNKKNFSIIFALMLGLNCYAEDAPVDIWEIEKKNIEQNNQENNEINETEKKSEAISELSIYEMQNSNQKKTIQLEENFNSNPVKIIGLYDPEDYGLDINMWSNSDGDQLKNIFSKLKKMNLSKDANEIVEITLLTNAYYPAKNISEKEFLKFKSDWLIKNSDLNLVEDYIIKNQIIDTHPKLTRYLVDHYLSEANLKKSCEIFKKNSEPIKDEYLSKFNIYCLIKSQRNDEAQIIFDLKKELGFNDKYFEKKINYLFGYINKPDNSISEKTILDFHLAHQTNSNFFFEPKATTDKMIWKYLSSFNLLNSLEETDISDLEKISTIELATHNRNYSEKKLLEIYKRFQFNINQLLSAQTSYKSLSNIEARALIYQKILLESEMVEKLKLLKILKNSFEKDFITNAFDTELKFFLKDMDPLKIPDNLTSFYYTNIQVDKKIDKNIKFNNDVLHQSKLINYFNGDYSKSKIEKDLNNFLKKIKRNKKYFISKNDIIFLEALKSDGIIIDKKYNDLYKLDLSEIPTDIQVMINNQEKAATLLRIAEVVGQDSLDKMDEDTMYFIIIALNQLNIDWIRNKILLKVLPLKV